MEWQCPVALAASRLPRQSALRADDRIWNYQEFDAHIRKCEQGLAQANVRTGESVAVLSPNCPEVLFAFFALLRRGASFIGLNTRLTANELKLQIARAQPKMVLRHPVYADQVEGNDLLALGRWTGTVPVLSSDTQASQVACRLFTSGTTGVARLIPLTKANFAAAAQASAQNLQTDPTSVWLGTLPLFHIGGLAMAYRCAADGSCLVLKSGFEVNQVIDALRNEGITHASLVPTMLGRVLGVLRQQEKPLAHQLQAVLVGGGPAEPQLLNQAWSSGLPVLQTYGLTEACSQVTTERLSSHDGTTAGFPLPGTKVTVCDALGQPVPTDVVGLIRVSGPSVSPQAQGTLNTGDLGALDRHGRLRIVSRRVDLIISGGENIYPIEVEAALKTMEAIVDVAVVPLKDEIWGQVPVVFMESTQPVSLADVEQHLRGQIGAYKIPKRALCVPALPRNVMGKIERNQLVKRAEIEWGDARNT
jgi:o-succinylbenzoate---CoA ligase